LTAEQRKRREKVRMRAADIFEEDVKVPCMARELLRLNSLAPRWGDVS
jgi:hypothetical protein